MAKATPHIHTLKEDLFAVVGLDRATNFGIVKGRDGSAILIDADIRRIDEIEEALQRTECAKVRHLHPHENFDHTTSPCRGRSQDARFPSLTP